MMIRTGLLATALLLATTSLASAQDLPVTGIISLDGMFEAMSYRADDAPFWSEGEATNPLAGLSARVGVVVAPDVSMQFDGWLQWDKGEGTFEDSIDGPDEFSWYALFAGGAAHLTYHAGDYLIGVVGGLGHYVPVEYPEYHSTYASLAIEGGYDAGDVRIIGQAGFTRTIAGADVGYLTGTPFASLTATYYLTPDFAVSAWGTIADYRYPDYPDDLNLRATLGGEVRYKLEQSPLILSVGYQARLFHAEYDTYDTGDYNSLAHRVTAGLHIPFGAGSSSLRELDRAAGLSLNEPIYGIDGLR